MTQPAQPEGETTRLRYLPGQRAACELATPAGDDRNTCRLPGAQPPRNYRWLVAAALLLLLLPAASRPPTPLVVGTGRPAQSVRLFSPPSPSPSFMEREVAATATPAPLPTLFVLPPAANSSPRWVQAVLVAADYGEPLPDPAWPDPAAPVVIPPDPIPTVEPPAPPEQPTEVVPPMPELPTTEPPTVEQPTATPELPTPLPPTATPPSPLPTSTSNPVATDPDGAVRTLLNQRTEAILDLDGDRFSDTIDPHQPFLQHEQAIWFSDLYNHPAAYYAATIERLRVDPDGMRATGLLTERYDLGDGQRQMVSEAVFRWRAGQWYYADLNFNVLASRNFQVYYFPPNKAVAQAMSAASERTWATVTADMGVTPSGVTAIKLYPSAALLQHSVMLSLPAWVGGWSMAGESIKTAYNGAPAQAYVNMMAHEFTHAMQDQRGLTRGNSPDWINEGLAVYEAEKVAPDSREVSSRPSILRSALREGRLFAWPTFPAFQQVAGGQVTLAYEQAYSGVAYLLERFGRNRFNLMLTHLVASKSTDAAFQQAFGLNLAQFDRDWRGWLAVKYK